MSKKSCTFARIFVCTDFFARVYTKIMVDNELTYQPQMVKSHDIHLDAEYADWIAELKHRYRSAQVKASVRVNTEKLRYNWELGRDLVQKKRRWNR